MRRLFVFLAVGLVIGSCSRKSSPTSPSSATPTRVIALTGPMDFGAVRIGQSSSAVLRISNQGNSTMTITGLSGTGGIADVLTANWTSGTIAAGASQSATFTFTPSTVQTWSGTIIVNGDHTSGANSIAFTGSGTLDGVPLWTQIGSTDSTFTIPSYVTRFRLDATSTAGRCGGLVLHITTQDDDWWMHPLPGCLGASPAFSGTYTINHGATAAVSSVVNVSWTFTEVR
jgi:hypothetical protein